MIDPIVGEATKLRGWRLLLGLLATLSVAVFVLMWRNHVSIGVMKDTIASFADVIGGLRVDGAPEETILVYTTEYDSMQASYDQSIAATSIVGSTRVVFGLMASGPGALTGLLIGSGSIGLEISTGFVRTQFLAGVTRGRFVVLKAVSWLQMAVISLTAVVIIGALANVFFDWLYHRPIALGNIEFGGFLAGALGSLAVVLVWASIAALGTYVTQSTIGGIVLGGGYLLLDAVVSQNIRQFADRLLTSNVWRVAGTVGGSPPGSESVAFNRIWFENYLYHTHSTTEAMLVIAAFFAGATAISYVTIRSDDIVL